jgi:hypothetical protein
MRRLTALALVLALCVGFAAGYLVHRQRAATAIADRAEEFTRMSHADLVGRWREVPDDPWAMGDGVDDGFLAFPYLAGSARSPATSGVVFRNREKTADGLNLYCSGHAAEAVLMDMDGKVLHRWARPMSDVWPAHAPERAREYWRRVHLLPDGSLLAIFGGIGIVGIDADSNLLFKAKDGNHHDLSVTDDGRIHVLGRTRRTHPRMKSPGRIFEDFLITLSPDGEELRRVSILDALLDSPWAALVDHTPDIPDFLHTNTVEVLDGTHADRLPAFRKGNVLLSILRADTVAVLDPEAGRIVWALTGLWRRQHQPTLLDGGRLLVFDNLAAEGESAVLEVDPVSQEVLWRYQPGPERLYSETCGSAQRLPNGHTLITESDRGRAIEITADGEVVWEFVSPHRAGENREFVATLFEVVRIPADYPRGNWLARRDR